MDLRKIRTLIDLFESSGIHELEVKDGEDSIRIVRSPPVVVTGPTAAPPISKEREEDGSSQRSDGRGFSIRSPMAGTFYRSPAPGEPPFVEEGQTVSEGAVLCIIESMKMMNEIKADRTGVVEAIHVDNGQAIETGTPLVAIL